MDTLFEPWVIITIAAAFLQNIRSSLQKHLKGVMGTAGATFVRFGFGLPVAILLLFLAASTGGQGLPELNASFLAWVAVAALAQILAQALLIYLFSFRNFAAGTAYSRTEPVLAAIFGFLFLGDRMGPGAISAIAISVFGVMLLSVARTRMSATTLVTSLFTRTTAIGLMSGAIFGLAAVSYRAASLSLGGPGYLVQGGFTLLVAIAIQTVLMAGWIAWRNPQEFRRIAVAWKLSALVGLVGATASFGWFTAMTLQQAALVKTVAQVELLFTMATTTLVFREDINGRELSGVILIVAGILALLWWT